MANIQKRVTSGGEVRYRVQVRRKGYLPIGRTFERRADARDWTQKTEAQLKSGLGELPIENHSFSELLDLFEKKRQEGLPRLDHGYRGHLRWWRSGLGQYLLSHISRGKVRECKEKLLQEAGEGGQRRGRATMNRYLGTLSTVLAMGVKLEWLQDNVVRKVDREEEPEGRVRFLSRPVDEPDCELDRLLKACGESRCVHLRDLVVLALNTGCRANELLRLEASHVHLHEEGFTLPAHLSKNGEARFVPLVGEALEVVRRRLAGCSAGAPYLLAGPGKGPPSFPRHAWEVALRRAGIESFRFHDLRHTHASYLAILGASPSELKESLGHKTLVMVNRYAHLANRHKSLVASRLAAEMASWKEGSEGAGGEAPPRPQK